MRQPCADCDPSDMTELRLALIGEMLSANDAVLLLLAEFLEHVRPQPRAEDRQKRPVQRYP